MLLEVRPPEITGSRRLVLLAKVFPEPKQPKAVVIKLPRPDSKTLRKMRDRRYRLKHRERVAEKNRRWYLANQDKVKQYRKKDRSATERQARYRLKNRDEINARKRARRKSITPQSLGKSHTGLSTNGRTARQPERGESQALGGRG